MKTSNKETRLIWCDLETSGTDPHKDLILECAVVITDGDLNELGSYQQVVRQPLPIVYDHMQPFVQTMHERSGLIFDIQRSDKGLEDLQRKLHGMFYELDVEPFQGVLAGSTVHFDKGFLDAQIPSLSGFFSHRVFDTSTLKAAHRLWMPCRDVPKEREEAKHRAMADVRYSLELAGYYKNTLFGPIQKKHEEEANRPVADVPMETAS